MTDRIHSSNAFKSSPRKNTPATLISSSMPQHFSRGLCSTISTGVPGLITELLYKVADLLSQVSGRSLQSLYFGNNSRSNYNCVGVAMHVVHLRSVCNTKTHRDRQWRELPHSIDQLFGFRA